MLRVVILAICCDLHPCCLSSVVCLRGLVRLIRGGWPVLVAAPCGVVASLHPGLLVLEPFGTSLLRPLARFCFLVVFFAVLAMFVSLLIVPCSFMFLFYLTSSSLYNSLSFHSIHFSLSYRLFLFLLVLLCLFPSVL